MFQQGQYTWKNLKEFALHLVFFQARIVPLLDHQFVHFVNNNTIDAYSPIQFIQQQQQQQQKDT